MFESMKILGKRWNLFIWPSSYEVKSHLFLWGKLSLPIYTAIFLYKNDCVYTASGRYAGKHFIISIFVCNIHPSLIMEALFVKYKLYLFYISIFILKSVITQTWFQMRFLCTLTSVIWEKNTELYYKNESRLVLLQIIALECTGVT